MEYIITRKKIKNFIIRIYSDKTIKISVPIRASDEEIETFISSKKKWMEKNLKKIGKKIKEKNIEKLKEKDCIKLFGNLYRKKIILFTKNEIELRENEIIIFIEKKDEILIQKEVEKYKLKKLSEILEEYIKIYSKLLNREIAFYKIKNLKATWGIYHRRQNYISFNFNLVNKDKKAIEYVVLHEMCHIFYLNHQKDFWNMLKFYMPNYKENQSRLE